LTPTGSGTRPPLVSFSSSFLSMSDSNPNDGIRRAQLAPEQLSNTEAGVSARGERQNTATGNVDLSNALGDGTSRCPCHVKGVCARRRDRCLRVSKAYAAAPASKSGGDTICRERNCVPIVVARARDGHDRNSSKEHRGAGGNIIADDRNVALRLDICEDHVCGHYRLPPNPTNSMFAFEPPKSRPLKPAPSETRAASTAASLIAFADSIAAVMSSPRFAASRSASAWGLSRSASSTAFTAASYASTALATASASALTWASAASAFSLVATSVSSLAARGASAEAIASPIAFSSISLSFFSSTAVVVALCEPGVADS